MQGGFGAGSSMSGGRKDRTSAFDLAVYNAWKMSKMAFVLLKRGADGEDDDEGISPDDAIDYTHRDMAAPRRAYYNESNDNLLLTRTGTNGT
jgi:chitin synthase